MLFTVIFSPRRLCTLGFVCMCVVKQNTPRETIRGHITIFTFYPEEISKIEDLPLKYTYSLYLSINDFTSQFALQNNSTELFIQCDTLTVLCSVQCAFEWRHRKREFAIISLVLMDFAVVNFPNNSRTRIYIAVAFGKAHLVRHLKVTLPK